MQLVTLGSAMGLKLHITTDDKIGIKKDNVIKSTPITCMCHASSSHRLPVAPDDPSAVYFLPRPIRQESETRRLCNAERGDFNDDRGRRRELLNYLEIVVVVTLRVTA